MALSQPMFLMVMNDASGEASATNIPNYGTLSANYQIAAQATVGTDFTWTPNSGPYTASGNSGVLQSIGGNSSHQAYLGCATATSGSFRINYSIGFMITSIPGGGLATTYLTSVRGAGNGDIHVAAANTSGTYQLVITLDNTGSSNPITHTFTGLTYGKNYVLSVSLDAVTNIAAVVSLMNLSSPNGGAGGGTFTPATVDWTSEDFSNNYPWMLRRNDFNNYGGLVGNLYFMAYSRSGSIWNATDLASIATNPTVIPGWPGAVVPGPGSKMFFVSSLTLSQLAWIIQRRNKLRRERERSMEKLFSREKANMDRFTRRAA